MADFPCDLHLARYQGAATRAYLNLYREDEQAAFRFSLCGDCLAEVVTAWLVRALYRGEDGRWMIPDGDGLQDVPWEPRTGPSGPRSGAAAAGGRPNP